MYAQPPDVPFGQRLILIAPHTLPLESRSDGPLGCDSWAAAQLVPFSLAWACLTSVRCGFHLEKSMSFPYYKLHLTRNGSLTLLSLLGLLQALLMVLVLGWLFVPIYIKAGVSIDRPTHEPSRRNLQLLFFTNVLAVKLNTQPSHGPLLKIGR